MTMFRLIPNTAISEMESMTLIEMCIRDSTYTDKIYSPSVDTDGSYFYTFTGGNPQQMCIRDR